MNRARTRQRAAPLDPALSKIPEPPEEFGQDGGKFYECYDKLAADMDDDMTFVLKEQLEGLLVFVSLTRVLRNGASAANSDTVGRSLRRHQHQLPLLNPANAMGGWLHRPQHSDWTNK